MGNFFSRLVSRRPTLVIECIQQLQQVEVMLEHLVAKYEKQIREQRLEARSKLNWKPDCMRHVRTIRVIRHHKEQLEKRLTACMAKRYQLEALNVTKMHIKAIQNTSSTFAHFLKEHQVERVSALQDTLTEMIEDACEINEVLSQETLDIDDEDIEEEYNSMVAELRFPTAPQGALAAPQGVVETKNSRQLCLE
jgi:hypothetical protein